MPSHEMTPTESAKYGARLSVWESFILLQAWAPLLRYGRDILAEKDSYKRGVIAAEACEWVASKTDATLDDKIAALVIALVKTSEAESLIRFVIDSFAANIVKK